MPKVNPNAPTKSKCGRMWRQRVNWGSSAEPFPKSSEHEGCTFIECLYIKYLCCKQCKNMRCRLSKYLIQDCNDVNCDCEVLGISYSLDVTCNKHVMFNTPLEIRNIHTRRHTSTTHTHTHAARERRPHRRHLRKGGAKGSCITLRQKRRRRRNTHTQRERGRDVVTVIATTGRVRRWECWPSVRLLAECMDLPCGRCGRWGWEC